MSDERNRLQQLQQESAARGDSYGYFEDFYREADGHVDRIPWSDGVANPLLVSWRTRANPALAGRRAVVVGCGLGEDAEYLAQQGMDVTAFDLSATAIAWCARRYPATRVHYRAADLFRLAAEWTDAFDLVFEANTLQVLPAAMRPAGIKVVASLVAPGGTLVVACRARADQDPPGDGPPWPLTRTELESFAAHGIDMQSIELVTDEKTPLTRRFVCAGVKIAR